MLQPGKNSLSLSLQPSKCSFCKLLTEMDSNTFVAELTVSTLFLNLEQSYRGRCILVYNQHTEDLFDLSPEMLGNFMADARRATQTIMKTFHPDRMNYAVLGNVVAHLHWHLIPRYISDSRWGQSPWPHSNRRITSAEYVHMVENLRSNLESE